MRCFGCKCNSCYKNSKTLQRIEDLLNKKTDVKLIGQDLPPASVNLCEATEVSEDMVINYTYKDQGRQMMILDFGSTCERSRYPMDETVSGNV